MAFVGWKSRGVARPYVGQQVSALPTGKRSRATGDDRYDRESAYEAAINLPLAAFLADGFSEEFAAFK